MNDNKSYFHQEFKKMHRDLQKKYEEKKKLEMTTVGSSDVPVQTGANTLFNNQLLQNED